MPHTPRRGGSMRPSAPRRRRGRWPPPPTRRGSHERLKRVWRFTAPASPTGSNSRKATDGVLPFTFGQASSDRSDGSDAPDATCGPPREPAMTQPMALPTNEFRRTLLICLALAALTLGAYWPVLHYGFINYDD